jgi:threonylcarbamoyladenosine tRNA methylthiotransferase MtaB
VRFSTVNLGCKVNRVETDTIAVRLESRGHVPDDESPQVVIVNTCTVTGEAEKKARKAVHRSLRRHPAAFVVVTGCAAAIDPAAFESMDERVVCVSKADAVQECEALGGPGADGLRRGDGDASGALRFGLRFHTRAGIKIQDGCDNACTYCVVHIARGKSVSRSVAECIAETRALEAAGAGEAVLTGIDLGSYDSNGLDLAGLLSRMREAAPRMRLRVSSIEPLGVSEQLISLLAVQEGWICRHLHLPLQSGSTKVLGEMARPYTAERYYSIVSRLRSLVEDVSFSTDIIVGFPGETEDDFRQTMDMVRMCRFSKVHVFRYSKRQGTPAASRTDQVDPLAVADRAHRLQELADELRFEEGAKHIGRTERVLVESHGFGMTESYYPVKVGEGFQRGSLIACPLTEFDRNGIFYL